MTNNIAECAVFRPRFVVSEKRFVVSEERFVISEERFAISEERSSISGSRFVVSASRGAVFTPRFDVSGQRGGISESRCGISEKNSAFSTNRGAFISAASPFSFAARPFSTAASPFSPAVTRYSTAAKPFSTTAKPFSTAASPHSSAAKPFSTAAHPHSTAAHLCSILLELDIVNEQAIKLISDLVKPWERLNAELVKPYSVNTKVSDFTQQANALAVNISHLPEALSGLKPAELSKSSRYYEVISDLADSSKHGTLRNPNRQCELSVGCMFERNDEGKVRFLRNVINVKHARHGQVDFMPYAMESAKYVAAELSIRTSWNPKILTNSGEFSSKIEVHASATNQVFWGGMRLQFVRMGEDGEYEPVDLDSTVEFVLTSDF